MKTLATLLALALSTCAPAHANPTADLAVRMCNTMTMSAMEYGDSGMSRDTMNALIDNAMNEPNGHKIMMGMVDLVDEGYYEGFTLELKLHSHCIRGATDLIRAYQ